ncbi:hypothetical protein CYY_001069 [Polysphondylium violaceum]|uniref:C2 domain-containing protein n=1 Tax=Polysphondylium violaceum TaxID=133409 RepID=A0A8J4Q9S7_9MYCE|nr:hypothetical protein CYY_001069 [Polysphondylium violaceum]
MKLHLNFRKIGGNPTTTTTAGEQQPNLSTSVSNVVTPSSGVKPQQQQQQQQHFDDGHGGHNIGGLLSIQKHMKGGFEKVLTKTSDFAAYLPFSRNIGIPKGGSLILSIFSEEKKVNAFKEESSKVYNNKDGEDLKQDLHQSHKLACHDQNISVLYVYFLSILLVSHQTKSIKVTISQLCEYFGFDNELHTQYAAHAYHLTKYYLYELNKRKETVTKSLNVNEFSDKKMFEKYKLAQLNQLNELLFKLSNVSLNTLSVIVNLFNAKGLPKKDMGSNSDPYVNIYLKKDDGTPLLKNKPSISSESFARSSCMKNNLSPEWNETFVVSTNDIKENKLVLSVYDLDLVTKNDFMGFMVVDLESEQGILKTKENIQEYPLLPKPPSDSNNKLFLVKFVKHVYRKSGGSLNSSSSTAAGLGTIKIGYYWMTREIFKLEEAKKMIDQIESQPMNGADEDQYLIPNLIDFSHDKCLKSFCVIFIQGASSCTFPDHIESLLNQYQKRVLLSPMVKLLCHLERLLEIFVITTQVLDQMKQLIVKMIEMLKNDPVQPDPILSRYKKTLEATKSLFKGLISKYGLSFPVSVEGNKIQGISEENAKLLGKCIEILRTIHYDMPSKELESMISVLVKQYIQFFYSMIKERSQIRIEDSGDFDNIVSLLDVYDAIETQITNDIDIYSVLFPKGVNIGDLSAYNYYKLLKQDTLDQLAREKKVCMETFFLLKKIQNLHNGVLQSYIDQDAQLVKEKMDIDNIFSKFVSMWISETEKQFHSWIQRSLSKEAWKPSDLKNGVLHSFSVMDLFSIFEVGKNHMVSLQINIDNSMFDYLSVVNIVYNAYIEDVMVSIQKDLDQNDASNPVSQKVEEINEKSTNLFTKFIQDTRKALKIETTNNNNNNLTNSSSHIKQQIPINNSTSVITMSTCVKLNCIEFSRFLLDEYITDVQNKLNPSLSDKVESTFKASFTKTRQRFDHHIEQVISKLGKWIKIALDIAIRQQTPSKKPAKLQNTTLNLIDLSPITFPQEQVDSLLEELLAFLNNELTTLSGNLYQPTFSRLIKSVWINLWREVDAILFSQEVLKKESFETLHWRSSLVLSMYPTLESFFNADGGGTSIDQLKASSDYLFQKMNLHYFKNDNHHLIK